MIDDIDLKILSIIQKNSRVTNAEIARRLEMAPSGILERIRKLENRGVIKGYETRLDPKALDVDLLAFVFVRTNEKLETTKVGKIISEIPGVLEVHDVAGEDCYLVKLRTKDPETLGKLLREQFGSIDTITSTRTTIVLETLKETSELPLDINVSDSGKT